MIVVVVVYDDKIVILQSSSYLISLSRFNCKYTIYLKSGSYNKRRIFYKGKSIRLYKNPKIGVCSECGHSIAKEEIKLTNIHHEKYDDLDI
jgi:hypothetical protein